MSEASQHPLQAVEGFQAVVRLTPRVNNNGKAIKPQKPETSNRIFCWREAGNGMRSTNASGSAIRPPMMVRMMDTSSAFMAETATLVAIAMTMVLEFGKRKFRNFSRKERVHKQTMTEHRFRFDYTTPRLQCAPRDGGVW